MKHKPSFLYTDRHTDPDAQGELEELLNGTPPPSAERCKAKGADFYLEDLHQTEPVRLTTHELVRLNTQAKKYALNILLPHELAALDPNGTHLLRRGFRPLRFSGVAAAPVVRCFFEYQLRNGKTEYGLLDLRLRHYGMLVDKPVEDKPSLEQRVQSETTARVNRLLRAADNNPDTNMKLPAGFRASRVSGVLRPQWELARVFDYTWDEAERLVTTIALKDTVDRVAASREHLEPPPNTPAVDALRHSATHYHAIRYLSKMQQAHLVVVDAEQVDVLPSFESLAEIEEYTRQVHLPFNPMFLDMEGPGGICPTLSGHNNGVKLRGALVWQEDDDLVVCPVGEAFGRNDRDYLPMGLVHFGLRPPALGYDVATYDLFDTGQQAHVLRVGADWATKYLHERHHVENDAPAPDNTASYDIPDPRSGFVPGRVDLTGPAYTEDHEVPGDSTTALWAMLTWYMAVRVLNVLFLLETPNVELVEGGDRPARRRAAREDRRIAAIVQIHSNGKRYVSRGGDGEHMDYSHRFEVRGHYKHFPIGTRTADNRPDLLRDCPRCGKCRRIWCPPFIKGSPDLPFVPKVRVFHGEDE